MSGTTYCSRDSSEIAKKKKTTTVVSAETSTPSLLCFASAIRPDAEEEDTVLISRELRVKLCETSDKAIGASQRGEELTDHYLFGPPSLATDKRVPMASRVVPVFVSWQGDSTGFVQLIHMSLCVCA